MMKRAVGAPVGTADFEAPPGMKNYLPLSPTASVDLEAIYELNSSRQPSPDRGSSPDHLEQLSLVIHPDKEIFPTLSCGELGARPRPLDLRKVDFIGTADVVKQLFTLPYQSDQTNQQQFALHKMGNTLLLDCIVAGDEEEQQVRHQRSPRGQARGPLPGRKLALALLDEMPSQSSEDSTDVMERMLTQNMDYLLGREPTPYGKPTIPYNQIGNEPINSLPSTPLSQSASTVATDAALASGVYRSDGMHVSASTTDVILGPSTTQFHAQPSALATAGPVGLSKRSLHAGSPFLPPPNYFAPTMPEPSRQVLSFNLHEMQLALGSDVPIYHTEEHPAFTVKTLDTTKEFELSTCLDFYLDNVMANVPELALALHAKGFIRGMKMLRTEDIPYLSASEIAECTFAHPGHAPHSTASATSKTATASTERRSSTGADNISGTFKYQTGTVDSGDAGTLTRAAPRDSVGPKGTLRSDLNGATFAPAEHQGQPMFDPKVIDIDATTILRFLKENCRRDDGTYILTQSSDGHMLHLYDLGLATVSKQKHFKWMLAMLSYRFATRLGHHLKLANAHSRVQIRQRQMTLLQSCYQMLGEIKDLGGEDHGTIRAAVLEQMADAHLSRVDYFTERANAHPPRGAAEAAAGSGRHSTGSSGSNAAVFDDEEDYDQSVELEEAMQLLSQSIVTLGDLIKKELAHAGGDREEEREEEGHSNSKTDSDASNKRTSTGMDGCVGVGALSSPLGGVVGGLSSMLEENDEGDDDEEADAVINSLAIQLAGVLHKLIQASLFTIVASIRVAKIADCVSCFSRLVAPCELWTQLKYCITRRNVARQKSLQERNRNANSVSPRGNSAPFAGSKNANAKQQGDDDSPLWGADMTIVQSLPILWDLLGETCREISKQTAGVSLQDSELRSRLQTLIVTWGRLSQSVLLESADLLAIPELELLYSPTMSVDDPAADIPDASPKGASKKARAKARAKAKARVAKVGELGALVDRPTKTERDWSMLTLSLPHVIHDYGDSVIISFGNSAPAPLQQQDQSSMPQMIEAIRALYSIHSAVTPLVLDDAPHLSLSISRQQLKKESQTEPSESKELQNGLVSTAAAGILTPELTSIVGEELQVTLLMTYCFLCATLMYHHKAMGGKSVSHHTATATATSETPFTAKKDPHGHAGNKGNIREGTAAVATPATSSEEKKLKKTQRAGGRTGPTGLKTTDSSVALCLRRLADSCNVIAQSLMKADLHIASLKSEGDHSGSSANTVDPVENVEAMKDDCILLANRFFKCALTVFHSAGDVVNAATVQCNLCSLMRLRATRLTSAVNSKVGSDINISGNSASACSANLDGKSLLKAVQQGLNYLQEALVHCEHAKSSMGSRAPQLAAVWDAVTNEQARTLLSMGSLRKTELLERRKGDNAKVLFRSDVALATLEESENMIVTPLEDALNLFKELRNDRQAAAAHFQLGSFYSAYWPLQSLRSNELLEKAIIHYREAHSYYSKYDVGPVLVTILADMSDLYLAAYAASEPFLGSRKKGAATGAKEEDDDWRPDEATETVVALLGGALQSLLESRFAFTSAVTEVYKDQIGGLAQRIRTRLGRVLLMLLKAHGKGHLPPASGYGNKKISSVVGGNLHPRSRSFDASTAVGESTASIGSNPRSPDDKSNNNKMDDLGVGQVWMTQVRNIYAELLRADKLNSSVTAAAASTPTTPVVSSATAAGSDSIRVETDEAVTAVPASVGIASAAQVYELLDCLNQNEWIKVCLNCLVENS